MKKFTPIIPAALVVLSLACSESTSPEDTTPYEALAPIAQAEIGAAGGTIQAEGIELIVPAGAFEGSESLVFYAGEDDGEFGGVAASSPFLIGGLPDSFDGELQLALAHDGTLEGESYIIASHYTYGEDSPDPELTYSLLEASESGGRLVAAITEANLAPGQPLYGEAGSESGKKLDRAIPGFIAGTRFTTKEVGDFLYRFPTLFLDEVDNLSLVLQAELAVLFEDFELTWTSSDIAPPIEVTILTGAKHPPRLHTSGMDSGKPLTARISIPVKEISPALNVELPGILGGMLIRLHQLICYEDGDEFYGFADDIISIAFARWAEGHFTVDPNFRHPSNFAGNEMAVIRGLLSGAPSGFEGLAGHMNGMAPLAKFLMDDPRYGLAGFRNTYRKVRIGHSVMTGLINSMSDPFRVWFPEFMIKYFSGEIYGVDYNLLIKDPVDSWTPGPDDEPFYLNDGLSVSFPDLSVKVIPIRLEAEYSNDAKIHVKTTSEEVSHEDLTVILFSRLGGGLQYLGRGQDWFLENIQQDLVSRGTRDLIAVVVNSSYSGNFRGDSEVDVEMNLGQSSGFTSVLLSSLWIDADIFWIPDGPTRPFEDYDLPEITGEGQITPPTFNVPVDFTDQVGGGNSVHYTGTVSGEINEDASVLRSLDVNVTFTYHVGDQEYGPGKVRVIVDGPLESSFGPGWISAYGTDVCTYVTNVEYEIVAPHGGSLRIDEWRCDEGNYLSIYFR